MDIRLNAGFIVGITIATILLMTGVIVLLVSKRKVHKNKWAWWLIIFGICALISAAINSALLG